MGSHDKVSNILRAYASDRGGHFAVWTAVLGLPLVGIASLSLDAAGAAHHKAEVKASLDAAVIAAVNKQNVDVSERKIFAQEVFDSNYGGGLDIESTVDIDGNLITMTASGEYPTTLVASLGRETMGFAAQSVGQIAGENPICVLALDAKSPASISFEDGVEFLAPTCTVHSNSRSSRAIVSQKRTNPKALSFCAVGGMTGDFTPNGRAECAPVEDPFDHIRAPYPGVCLLGELADIDRKLPRLDDLSNKAGPGNDDNYDDDDYDDDDEFGPNDSDLADYIPEEPLSDDDLADKDSDLPPDSDNVANDYAVLRPGTYCGGLTIDGRRVRMQPGVYIMAGGPLTIKNGAEVQADGVTISLDGITSVLKIESGAQLDMSAMRSGPYAGLAFLQPKGVVTGNGANIPRKSHMTTSADVSITGTVYIPEQNLLIRGDGQVGATAPATSFIAEKIAIGGSGRVVVDIDHIAAGLPPIQPRASDGARLLR